MIARQKADSATLQATIGAQATQSLARLEASRTALAATVTADGCALRSSRSPSRSVTANATPPTRQWGVTPHPDRSTYLVSLLAEVPMVLEAGVADLSPKARRELRTTYQRLALLTGS